MSHESLGTITLDNFLKEIEKLKEASALLEQIYLAIGPHNSKKISPELMESLNTFFHFSDEWL